LFTGKFDFNTGDIEDDTLFQSEFDKYKKSVKIWGGEFAFGAEYYFDDNFSISGEFGIRYFKQKYNDSYEKEIYNPETTEYQTTEITTTMNNNISPTFSKISLNFYF
jgi:hypothetical protein